jgi:hypothetical protein
MLQRDSSLYNVPSPAIKIHTKTLRLDFAQDGEIEAQKGKELAGGHQPREGHGDPIRKLLSLCFYLATQMAPPPLSIYPSVYQNTLCDSRP